MMYDGYIMKVDVFTSRNKKMIRTQISLTPYLKAKVEQQAKRLGESMADFLRKAAVYRLEREMEKKLELSRIADQFIVSGEGGAGGQWSTKKKIDTWFKDIRNEWD